MTDCPGMRSAPPSEVCSVRDPPETAAMDANTVFCSLQSMKVQRGDAIVSKPGGCSHSFVSCLRVLERQRPQHHGIE